MRQVTLAAIFTVMILYDDLLEPLGTRKVSLVATNTKANRRLDRQNIGIIRVIPAHAMTPLTGERLVRVLRQCFENV